MHRCRFVFNELKEMGRAMPRIFAISTTVSPSGRAVDKSEGVNHAAAQERAHRKST